MTEKADNPPKSETAPEVVAHAPEWMVGAFGMGNLVKAGLVVAEPSPGVTVRRVGKQLVPVPPKSEWKNYRVLWETGNRCSRVVRAPDEQAAADVIDQLAEDGNLGVPADSKEDYDSRFFEVDQDDIGETNAAADFEWEPEADDAPDPDQSDRDADNREDAGLPRGD